MLFTNLLALLPLLSVVSSAPVLAPRAPVVTCYYDDRATTDLLINVILSSHQSEHDVPGYPWEYNNFGVTFRGNGVTPVMLSTAVREAREYIVATCRPADGSNYGGLVNMGSHRLRLSNTGH